MGICGSNSHFNPVNTKHLKNILYNIGPSLYKCYTNVLCLLGRQMKMRRTTWALGQVGPASLGGFNLQSPLSCLMWQEPAQKTQDKDPLLVKYLTTACNFALAITVRLLNIIKIIISHP